jgi:hypothetical protein
MAAAAARRLLSRRASSSSLSALLRRGAVPEQSLVLRPAVVAAASRLGFQRGMARRPGGDGYVSTRSGAGGDRAPMATEMAPLFPGCDYEHWLIVMDKPGGEGASKQQMIDCYIQTLAKVLGRYVRRLLLPPSEAPIAPCRSCPSEANERGGSGKGCLIFFFHMRCSEEEAKKKIYNVSCERYFGFGCEIDEETSNKLEGSFHLCSMMRLLLCCPFC